MSERVGETPWQRALSDTTTFMSGGRFWLFDTILTLAVAGSTTLAVIQWGPDNAVVRAAVPVGAALAWLLLGAIGVLGWNLIRAPYHLLSEVRGQLATEESDVDHVVEKLRNQDAGSGRNMNMADVLDELADSFAGGVALNDISFKPGAKARDRFLAELRLKGIIDIQTGPGPASLAHITCHLTDFGAQVVQRLRAE